VAHQLGSPQILTGEQLEELTHAKNKYVRNAG